MLVRARSLPEHSLLPKPGALEAGGQWQRGPPSTGPASGPCGTLLSHQETRAQSQPLAPRGHSSIPAVSPQVSAGWGTQGPTVNVEDGAHPA